MFHIDRRSLRFRLLTRLGGASLAVVLIAWYLHGVFLHELAKDFLGERLKDEASHIVTLLKKDERPVAQLMVAAREESLSFHHFYVLRVGNEVSTSLPAMPTEMLPLLEGKGDALFMHQLQQQPMLAYRYGFDLRGQRVQLLIAENFSPVEKGLTRVHWWIGASALLLWGILVSLNLLAVRRGLKPLSGLRHQLSELQTGHRKRIALTVPSELDTLVSQLNKLLDEFDRRLTRSRESVANLSHALKTPLAALTQVLRGTRPINEVRRGKMLQRVETIHSQLETELRRARIAGPRAGQTTRPVEEAQRLIEMFQGLYPQRTFLLECLGVSNEHADSWVNVETQDFTEMLGILLDNAGKWSVNQVQCRVTIERDQIVLCVEDDGPGVPQAQLAHLGERGWRQDETYPGYGLGLSILSHLVKQYAGYVSYSSGAAGGLRVNVHLPTRK
ncbi:ATP-binding protein [Cobetia marina]|uniref:ATP-binding protein n=1 Tax=Cobetia marina TaxID=28258 RepID=UPI00254949A1|nr:ATP-binding protein [Cobetia pacifica]MDI6002481.1 ATP-binding protein [Cobetia pacifica]